MFTIPLPVSSLPPPSGGLRVRFHTDRPAGTSAGTAPRQHPRITLIREFAQDLCERTDSVPRDETRGLVEHFARDIRHILKVDMCDLAGADAINIFELIVARPKVVAIEKNPK